MDGTRGDTVLLDLSPGIHRAFPSLEIFPDRDRQGLTYRPIVNADAERGRRSHQNNDIGNMLMQLSAATREDRRGLANRMLVDVINGGGMGGREALILSMVANGSAVVDGEDDDDSEDDDDESDGDNGEDATA